MKRINLIGRVVGYWTVVSYVGTESKKWHCQCRCGVERDIRGTMLRSGRSKSCGCKSDALRKETRDSGTRSPRYRKMTPRQRDNQREAHRKWKARQGKLWAANKSCLHDHGLSLEQKRELLMKQGFKCANSACDFMTTHPSAALTEWCFDHDHSCCPEGKSCEKCRRGLLCQPCNRAMGHVHDIPERLEGLAMYLRSWDRRLHGQAHGTLYTTAR
jgi:hypothetical protein